MNKFLNNARSAENPISANRRIISTIAVLFLGIALGFFSKYLDFRQAELPSVFAAIDGALDVHNFLGRFAIWVLLALCISIYSNSAIRASVNAFVFFVGMVTSYYLYSNYVAGFFPRSYAMIWFGFTIISPFLAFACWYAKGKSKSAFMLSTFILAVLFNMTFVYGWGYFEARSVLELVVFIIGLTGNPFDKQYLREKDCFESTDQKIMINRLNYLKEARGIGVFTANPGMGKTYALRCFEHSLNKNLFDTKYFCLSTISVAEFYKQFCELLGLDSKGGKTVMFKSIQERLFYMFKEKRKPLILAIDEAQYLNSSILHDLKMLMNFNYDSLNCFTLILCGEPYFI